jgi:hypothetical protein
LISYVIFMLDPAAPATLEPVAVPLVVPAVALIVVELAAVVVAAAVVAEPAVVGVDSADVVLLSLSLPHAAAMSARPAARATTAALRFLVFT